jgi:hypothetical protein
MCPRSAPHRAAEGFDGLRAHGDHQKTNFDRVARTREGRSGAALRLWHGAIERRVLAA